MKSIRDLRWQDDRAGHIARHQVVPTEVEEAVLGDQRALLERAGAARRDPSQTVYVVLGRTAAGRYLAVALIDEGRGVGFPLTARDMNRVERRRYSR